MNSREFRRWLKKQGCTFEESRGKGGHITVRLGSKVTVMPTHGQKTCQPAQWKLSKNNLA